MPTFKGTKTVRASVGRNNFTRFDPIFNSLWTRTTETVTSASGNAQRQLARPRPYSLTAGGRSAQRKTVETRVALPRRDYSAEQ